MAALLQRPSEASRQGVSPGSLKFYAEPLVCTAMPVLLLSQAEVADLFASFLSLAGSLASATAEPVQRAGSRMYSELFLAYQDAYFRQVEEQIFFFCPCSWSADGSHLLHALVRPL